MGRVLDPPLQEDPPAWAGDYVGIPWVLHGRAKTGCDCWGLARLVLLRRAGIALPSYGESYAGADLAHLDEAAAAVAEQLAGWRQVGLDAARPLDLVLLRIWGRPMHIAVLVARGWILHSQQGCDSILERLTDRLWINRVEGVYRHGRL